MGVNALTYVLAVASTRSLPSSIMLAFTDLALSGICLFAAVAVVNKAPRFQQAFTALAGGTAVLNLAAAPILWLDALSASFSVGLMNLVIILWGLAIIAHVLRHTLDVKPWVSIGLAFGFYVVVVNLMAITGVIGEPSDGNSVEQQMSINQSFTADWLRKA